jgi:hypothetical protein
MRAAEVECPALCIRCADLRVRFVAGDDEDAVQRRTRPAKRAP